MGFDLKQLAEQRQAELRQRQQQIIARWNPYIKVVEKYMKEKENRELPEYVKANIAQCCDNVFDFYVLRSKGINETTYSDSINFARVQLPLIASLLPSLVLNEVALVMALERRQGLVFYLNLKYGTQKGSIGSGDTMISAKTGHASGQAERRYATDRIYGEILSAADGATLAFTGTSLRKPVTEGTFLVKYTIGGTDYVGTDDGNGILAGTGIDSGTINYDTGAWTVTFASGSAPDTATNITVDYRFNMERDTEGIGEVDVEVTQETVEADIYALRAKYSIISAIDLQKAHGFILDDELMKFVAQEIKFNIDELGLDEIKKAADVGATTPGTFDATVGSGQEWVWRKHEFNKLIEKGSANIFQATLRAVGNFIIGDVNITSLVRQLDGFQPSVDSTARPPAGPYVAGTLNGRTVICNPFYAANQGVIGFRGDNYLFAGFAFLPYVPLYATPQIITSDLISQQGMLSMTGLKRINDKMFTKFDISNY